MDNSEQIPNSETSEEPTGDQHDDTVLTSVARVVGSALGTVASTASKVLAPSTNEPVQQAEHDQPKSSAQKPKLKAEPPEAKTQASAPKPAEQSQRPAANEAPQPRTASGRTKAAESPSRPRVKSSSRTTGQASGGRMAKKKAKAKAHRRKIKRSNTNG